MVILSPAALYRTYWTQEPALIWSVYLHTLYTGSLVLLCVRAPIIMILKSPSKKRISCEGPNTRPTYAVLSLTEVYHLNSWSFKADKHLKDSVLFLLLTSSRIDLIRTSQNLACLILFCMSFKYFEILFFLPPSKMIELSFILNIWMFLLMSMVISIIKDHSFHHPNPIYLLQLVIGRNRVCCYCYAIFQMVFINIDLIRIQMR